MSHCQVVVVAAAFTTHPGKLDGQLGRVPRVLGGIVQESSGDITGIYGDVASQMEKHMENRF